MHNFFFSIRYFILYKYFENNYVFTCHVLGYVLPIVFVEFFIFAYLLLTLTNLASLLCWYFA